MATKKVTSYMTHCTRCRGELSARDLELRKPTNGCGILCEVCLEYDNSLIMQPLTGKRRTDIAWQMPKLRAIDTQKVYSISYIASSAAYGISRHLRRFY